MVIAESQKAEEATLTGIVEDGSGAEVGGARIKVIIDNREFDTNAGGDGQFFLPALPAGKYTMIIEANTMSAFTLSGELSPGEHADLGELKMSVGSVTDEVEAMSVKQQAEVEMKVQEQQRLVGIIPNYYVAYNWDAAPMTAKQKYKLATHNVIDPFNAGIAAAIAGIQYWQNDFRGYGRGWSGYGKRFGANEGDLLVGTFIGGAVLPALLHQDPRYFYMGKGSILHRTLYALSTAVICRGDNGKWQPNYSSIGGDVAAGAIAQLYYPKTDHNGAAVVIEDGLLGALFDGVGNVAQEFLFKMFTPHSPKYSSTTRAPKR
ncbi:MAG: carboxypeptidase-like regulatory domain-containing protein [Bryocella sp.]